MPQMSSMMWFSLFIILSPTLTLFNNRTFSLMNQMMFKKLLSE